MNNLEKVIKGLLCIKGDYIPCATCKYANVNGCGRGDRCKKQCASDAIALLKEQEPKTVLHINDGNYCPRCSTIATRTMGVQEIRLGTNYCPYCGQAVKWE